MIYLKHNTEANFANANIVGEDSMKNDLVLSELGKRIAVRPEQVVGFLKEAGIKVSDNVSANKLVELVSKNIPGSKKLTVLFAEDIDGKRGKSEGAVVIADSIHKFFKMPTAKSELMKYTRAIKGIAYSADGIGEGTKWGARIAVGLVVVLGIGYVVYKNKQG